MTATQNTTKPPVEALADRAKKCANRILESDEILAVSHIDADGLTAGAIASSLLERAGIPHVSMFKKQLDKDEIADIAAADYDTVLFTDFGSGQLDIITEHESEFEPIIADHHEIADATTEYHLNPLLEGIDGSTELSGAGTTYVLARWLSVVQDDSDKNHDADPGQDNKDLASLAVVGATGDMQGGPDGLTGANAEIVAEAIEAGVIEQKEGLTMYGKQTRPIPKMLEYSSDLDISGITGSQAGSIKFLNELGIDLKDDAGNWKRWPDLTESEQQQLVSGLIQKAIDKGTPIDRVNDIVGPIYELPHEEERTALRSVGEFSTLLNSTARYERADIGLAVCLGDRDEAYATALDLLLNHQKRLSEGIDMVVNMGTETKENIQYFDAGNSIKETIVGIIAGMALGESGIDKYKPIIAFAAKESDEPDEPDELKVSSRTKRRMTSKGVDLSVVMQEASQHVGGDGGGHDIAAGATIPAANKEAFLNKADEIIASQLDE